MVSKGKNILGIDPGLTVTGFGFINFTTHKITVIDYGILKANASNSLTKQLFSLYKQLSCLLKLYQPDEVAVEQLFFGSNSKTAFKVGQARGAILLACGSLGYEPAEYTPLEVKMALTGYGRADKQQVQSMVKNVLALKERPQPDDAADALAVAVCHAHSLAVKKAVANAWQNSYFAEKGN